MRINNSSKGEKEEYFQRYSSQSKSGKDLDKYFSQIKTAIKQATLRRNKSSSAFALERPKSLEKKSA